MQILSSSQTSLKVVDNFIAYEKSVDPNLYVNYKSVSVISNLFLLFIIETSLTLEFHTNV